MAFALSVARLEESLKESGCPVCRLGHETAIRSIDTFLWENANDSGVRRLINDAYGFCPEHARMLVAVEMSSSGPVLGVNTIYEVLARNVSRELKDWGRRDATRRTIWSLLRRIPGLGSGRPGTPVLKPEGKCLICSLVEQSEENTLSTLFEELSAQNSELAHAYRQSSGLCLQHLRTGLECLAVEHPAAAEFLVEDTARRLDLQRQHMLEYIRKHNWAYRDESLTPDERAAWLRTLIFFTGYSEDRFTHHVDRF